MVDLTTITVDDFKTQFARDFPYLPVWVAGSYNQGEEVYYEVTRLFYRARSNGVTSTPDTNADWEQIDDNVINYVQDSDITRAFGEAQISFNQALFGLDAEIRLAYLYMTAHYLVNDLKTARAGAQSTGDHTVASRSVGNVSESYAIPEAFTKNPIFTFYTKSGYGLKYLNLIFPKIKGNVVSVQGGTNA